MQEKIEKLVIHIDELTRQNRELHYQLTKESAKRNEIVSKLQGLETEVIIKKNEKLAKNKKNLSLGPEALKKIINEPDEGIRASTRHETLTTELSESDENLKKNNIIREKQENLLSNFDILHFLQCEAAALESFF